MQWLWVALGGALGSVLRFLMQARVQSALGGLFPWGTLSVNVLGSAVIGAFAAFLDAYPGPHASLRSFLMVGILGGFTTFSSFSFENLGLLRAGETRLALLYMAASNAAGIGAAVVCWVAAKAALRALQG